MKVCSKAFLRKKYLTLRKQLNSEEINVQSKAIINQFTKQFGPFTGKNMHLYLPISNKNEINTMPLVQSILQDNGSVFTPSIVGDNMIQVPYFMDSVLIENRFGGLEVDGMHHPQIIDIIVFPLIYCDPYGNRIGYGKGFYDRFFQSLDEKTTKVGFSFFAPSEKISDIEEHDIALDYLIMPDDILSFSTKSLK